MKTMLLLASLLVSSSAFAATVQIPADPAQRSQSIAILIESESRQHIEAIIDAVQTGRPELSPITALREHSPRHAVKFIQVRRSRVIPLQQSSLVL